MSFDYSEFKKFRNNFAGADKDLDQFLAEFLLDMGLEALTRTKENTPVDTGLLRNMWQLGDSHNVVRYYKGENQKYKEDPERSRAPTIKSVKRSGNDLIIEIYNNVDYTSFVEDGTKFQAGKHMARKAIAQVEKEIPARFKNEFRKWLERLEKL